MLLRDGLLLDQDRVARLVADRFRRVGLGGRDIGGGGVRRALGRLDGLPLCHHGGLRGSDLCLERCAAWASAWATWLCACATWLRTVAALRTTCCCAPAVFAFCEAISDCALRMAASVDCC